MRAVIIESGTARVILNELHDGFSLCVTAGNGGTTVILTAEKLLALATAAKLAALKKAAGLD
jgi:hypothetical protein